MRRTLRTVSIAIAALFVIASVTRAEPVRHSLDGAWQVHAADDCDAPFAATVPGVIHTDLLAAGKIADPFDRDNAKSQEWIDKKTWVYRRAFTVPADVRSRRHVLLRFEGLDTIATITLNGREFARTDNMFRTYEFDVGPLLRDGENELQVTFSPLDPYIAAFKANAPRVDNAVGLDVANVRKAPYMNGWDFCPRARTCGIYKHVELLAYDDTRLRGLRVEPVVAKDNAAAKLRVTPVIDGAATAASVTVSLGGRIVATRRVDAGDASPAEIDVPEPQLWWPRGMGGQPLYDVAVELLDAAGTPIDRATRRVGLRRIELVPKRGEESMRLIVNGRPFFARGANWVPPDLFLPRVTPDRIRQLVHAAADANMNMLRTWGGGAYEDDAFFDACDALGLLVWFDFKFACSAYPGGNPAFVENVRREIDDQLLRLGSHPSIAVWCGNNECLGLVTEFKVLAQKDYDAFFRGVVGGRVAELLPGAVFVEGSPGPAGDEHNWWIWHVGADFEKYRESHGFMSEFGFQSFPHPATVDAHTRPEDRASVLSPVMKARQHNGNGRGNEQMLEVLSRYFREPKDVESTLWLSQIGQAHAMQIGIAHWRGDWPRSSGALVWQLNDCFPGPSWSLVDYHGRPKAAWYAVKRAFGPVSIDGVLDEPAKRVRVRVATDLADATSAELRWKITDLSGAVLASGDEPLKLNAGVQAVEAHAIDVAAHLADRSGRLLWLTVRDERGTLATQTVFLARPKSLALERPTFDLSIDPAGPDSFTVRLRSTTPALWTWLSIPGDPDARFDDNFFDLAPSEPRTLRLTPSKPTTADVLKQSLTVRSLFDLAGDAGAPATKP